MPTASHRIDPLIERMVFWCLVAVATVGACLRFHVAFPYERMYLIFAPKVLGGHLKTGQSWTGQNRPVGEPPQARVLYRGRT